MMAALAALVNGGVSTLVVTESAFGVQSNPVNISVPGLSTLTATDRVSGNSATDSTLTFTLDIASDAQRDADGHRIDVSASKGTWSRCWPPV